MFIYTLLNIIRYILRGVQIVFLISLLGEYIDPTSKNKIFNTCKNITYPILKRFRLVLPIGGINIDITYIIIFIIIEFLDKILRSLYF